MKKFRFVVIGGGAAGIVTAMGAAGMGFSVALIEKNRIGGECSWTGCVPSKALLSAAKEARRIGRSSDWGLELGGIVDTAKVMGKVRELTQLTADRAQTKSLLENSGVEIFFGTPRFLSANEVEVNGETLHGRDIIIATGSSPVRPSDIGLEKVKYYTNQEIFSLDTIPPSLAIIGGGPIGIEMAQAFSRLGSRVVVFQSGPRILPKDDAELAGQLAGILRGEGVEIKLNIKVKDVAETSRSIAVNALEADGSMTETTVSALLVAAGRQPNVEGLGLEGIGVDYNSRGIKVNEYLQTTVPHIWACGDSNGKYQFSHIAEVEARLTLQNMLLPIKRKVDYFGAPWTTFTDPELSHVGLTEQEAIAQGLRHRVYRQQLAHIDRAIEEQEDKGLIKIIAGDGGKILGASVLATNSAEMVNEILVHRQAGFGLDKVSSLPHVYPSWGYGLQRAADPWLVDLGKKWFVRFGLEILRKL